MKSIAAGLGISDVALAKHCKKAGIPVPSRGYWARKQAGKSTIRTDLPPRFPGASDRVGGSKQHHHFWTSDWPEKTLEMAVPPVPTFDEDLATVEKRVCKLVGKVQCPSTFEIVHPLVAKLLAHDEERRKEFKKWHSNYYAPKYDAGIERRRLLIINALFIAAANLGCSPSMSTSKYGLDTARQINIKIGESRIHFTLETITSKKPRQSERLCLAFDAVPDRAGGRKSWEDKDRRLLEYQLADVLVGMLIAAEVLYRENLIGNRQWVIESKARAAVEIKRREEEAERHARELQEKQARERIARLLYQAKALNRANQIRAYVDTVLLRAAEIRISQAEIDEWAIWARQEADSIDPVKNGAIETLVSSAGTEG
jgi:hypothetical protein